jgi:hypothetical protein
MAIGESSETNDGSSVVRVVQSQQGRSRDVIVCDLGIYVCDRAQLNVNKCLLSSLHTLEQTVVGFRYI